MLSVRHYSSPLGSILIAADEIGLTGLWFDGQKYFPDSFAEPTQEKETPVLRCAVLWLDGYFRGERPDFTPPLHPSGTPFRRSIRPARRFAAPCGTFCCKYLTVKP